MKIVEKMKKSDWNEVLNIYIQGMETKNATFETTKPEWESWEDWDKDHLSTCRLVVKEGTKILGWTALLPISSRQFYSGVAEVSIYLDKDSVGKGIGSMLMKSLIEQSEKDGFWMLQSEIFPENIGSIRIHDKFAFRKVGVREKIGKMEGMDNGWRDVVLMERRSEKVGI